LFGEARGDLTGENGRATPVAFLEDLVEVTTGTGIERFEAPIIEDQELLKYGAQISVVRLSSDREIDEFIDASSPAT
jgi:hypothetical protein